MAMFFRNNSDEDAGRDDARRRYGYDENDDELLDDLGYDEPPSASRETREREESQHDEAPVRGTRYDPDDLDDYRAHRGRYFRHGYDDEEDMDVTEERPSRRIGVRPKLKRKDDDDEQDFFTGPDIPDPPVKKAKAPVLKPEDPDYWEQDESEWEHLRPTSKIKKWIWIGGIAFLLIFAFAVRLRYFSPYREAATQSGYVESLEDRGKIFKTIEGVLLPYKNLMDTTRVYDHDFIFTAENSEVAKTLYRAMKENKPVFVTYKEYSATVPWRGESRIVVTAAEITDPSKLLPPDRQPKLQ